MTNLYDSFGRSDSPADLTGRLSSASSSFNSSPALSSNGDSADSLRSPTRADGIIRAMPAITRNSNSIRSNKSLKQPPGDSMQTQRDLAAAQKSPILIKYNYYDQNGTRQEQQNETKLVEEDYQQSNVSASKPIERLMSPTFKQTLDQIVKKSEQQMKLQNMSAQKHTTNNNNNLPADNSAQWLSKADTQLVGPQFARRYKMWSYEQRCLRCQNTVYQMDKVGPLKDFTFYHQNCFKCRECGTKLTLKTYFNNQQSSVDQEVYCHRHCPKTGPGKLDNQSVGIRAALNAPKVFEQQQQQWAHLTQADLATSEQLISQMQQHKPLASGQMASDCNVTSPSVDSRALHIQHAVAQTKLQNLYKQQPQLNQRLSQFINMRLEYLEPKQKMLEMRHREEEDALFKAFETKWRLEESSITEQIRSEWQSELQKLLDKYKRQLSSISATEAAKLVTLAQKANPSSGASELIKTAASSNSKQDIWAKLDEKKMIEFERINLEATMTIKLDRKKETLKRKLKEFERQATAELVEKQSKEMLTLISLKLAEFKEQQKRKIGSDLDQFEAIETLANQFESSFRSLADENKPSKLATEQNRNKQQEAEWWRQTDLSQTSAKFGIASEIPPPPGPANALSKLELYNSDRAEDSFGHIDQMAISVASQDQQTFTDLVHHLTRNCLNDVEKVRAIFRWITVKNLNTMHFDSSVKPDTPLGLLRGIKNGSESYHVLFKRLCSYAGLHCVVIKGFSKSAGYQPGVRFEGSRFRNSWNAVYVAGAWRFVQCNWGARHLVSVAVQDKYKDSSGAKGSRSELADQADQADLADLADLALRLPAVKHSTGRSSQSAKSSGSRKQQQLEAGLQWSQVANLGRRGLLVAANSTDCSSSVSVASELSAASLSSGELTYANQRHSRHLSPQEANSPTYANKLAPATKKPSGLASDNLRYEYDDHYFLTDPDEFIHEFFPHAADWQLIKPRPITLAEFEQLPFVRSLFFRYGLYFPQSHIKSVLQADSSGATTIKIGMPTHLIPNLIFHYNLRYYDSEEEYFEGVSLKRFVMQSIENGSSESLSNVVSFRVHLPQSGAFILDIFANSITPNQYISGEPMRFKSVCKFKIVAKNLKTVMIPLPDCASGEFGPMKATRLFGIIPLTHESSLISVKPSPSDGSRQLEIQFRMTRPLVDFMATLHKNGFDERQLSRLCKIYIEGDIITISIKFFEDGQYGLDVYTRDRLVLEQPSRGSEGAEGAPKQKQLLTHCCKYLINVKSH